MVINESRQLAMELTRNFCEAVSIGAHNGPDFYKMLWIIHWAIEQYGWKETRKTLEDIMLAEGFDPVQAPVLLRDALLTRESTGDSLGEWFTKAISRN